MDTVKVKRIFKYLVLSFAMIEYRGAVESSARGVL